MNELKWFVQIAVDYGSSDQRPRYYFRRAYSWQDAFDQIPKDRFAQAGQCWSLFPLERNGSYYDGTRFVAIDRIRLVEAGFYEGPSGADGERPPDPPGAGGDFQIERQRAR